MTCTHQEAENYLREDLQTFEQAINSNLPTPILQHQFDACVCLSYNIGAGGFLSSSIYRKIKAGTIASITEQNFTAWNKVRDSHGVLVESKGLTRRRKSEYYLFSTGQIKTQF
jgi:lysozyme